MREADVTSYFEHDVDTEGDVPDVETANRPYELSREAEHAHVSTPHPRRDPLRG